MQSFSVKKGMRFKETYPKKKPRTVEVVKANAVNATVKILEPPSGVEMLLWVKHLEDEAKWALQP